MLIGQAIFLGIIQGFTEFLPISSSGHLIIIPEVFNWPDQGLAFDAWIHLGTLLAVVLYFRKDLKLIIRSFLKPEKKTKDWKKFFLYLLIASIPAGIFGFLFNDAISTILRNSTVVSFTLIFWALILWVAENYSDKYSDQKKELPQVGFWQSTAVGFWQVLALIPGTSRSGVTMTGAMLAGMNRRLAVSFSFLLSIPIIAAAGVYSFADLLLNDIQMAFDWQFALAGFFFSFLSGYLAIAFLLKIITKWGFKPFIVYRLLLALIIIFFV